jgi:ADP-ribosylglycohydrolase
MVATAEKKGSDPATEANGALMRVSPLGIYGWKLEEQALVEFARQDCRLTHPNKICQDANVVFVLTIARAIKTGDMENAAASPPADFITHKGWVLLRTPTRQSPARSTASTAGDLAGGLPANCSSSL